MLPDGTAFSAGSLRLGRERSGAFAATPYGKQGAAFGSFWLIDDGTLVKPVAVDTTVPDGRALVRTYTVKQGDTLVGIAWQYRWGSGL